MKKGFTLIEIIMSISLILIIGTSVTVFYIKEKKDNTLNLVFKQLIECSQLYIENEYDENGITYKNGLLSGGKAVVIPLNELEEKGYLSNEMIKTLEDKNITKDEYILAGVFEDTKDLCSSSDAVIKFEASWNDKLKGLDEPIYMCGYANKKKVEEDIPIDLITEELNFKAHLGKIAVSQEFYDNAPADAKNYLVANENGKFIYYNDKTENIYTYYRGAVDNNYLQLGEYTNESGQKEPLKWRIVWINDDNRMKIVLDKAIPITVKNKNGKDINVKDIQNNSIYNFVMYGVYPTFPELGTSLQFINFSSTLSATLGDCSPSCEKGYTYTVTDDDIFDNFKYYSEDNHEMYAKNSFYWLKSMEWYNKTDLSNYSFITKENNFCVNSANIFYYNFDLGIEQSNNFECSAGNLYNSSDTSSYIENNVSLEGGVPVGFLNYGDIVRAGLSNFISLKIDANTTIKMDLKNSGNYLINSDDSFVTSSLSLFDKDYDGTGAHIEFVNYYYYSNYGLESGSIYNKSRTSGDCKTCPWYEVKNRDSNKILFGKASNDLAPSYNGIKKYGKNDSMYEITYTFLGNALKPSIILDMSDVKLSDNSGTKDDSYKIIEK